MAMAAIDIEAMQSLVTCMDTAASELRGRKGDLVGILSGVTLDTSKPYPLETAASWVEGEVPGLRRRLSLARAIAKADPAFAGQSVRIDESKISTLTPAQAQAKGSTAAAMIRGGDDVDGTLAAMMSKYGNDPYFAAALAKGTSPQQIAEWIRDQGMEMHSLQTNGFSGDYEKYENMLADYQKVCAGLSDALGTATRNTSPDLKLPSGYADTFADTITDENNINGEGAALAMLLRRGTFGTDFLNTVAPKVYDYERDELQGKWRDRTPYDSSSWFVYDADGNHLDVHDPMSGVLAALGNNADAAQHFFTTGGQVSVTIDGKKLMVSDRMRYLIQDRTWAGSKGSDEGDGLGRALEAATTYYRNGQTSGKDSAALATQAVALTGDCTEDGQKMYKSMRDNMANILASYSPDLMRAASNNANPNELDSHVVKSTPGFPPLGKGGVWGMAVDQEMLRRVLGTIGEDDKNVERVMAGALAAQQIRMNWALENGLDPSVSGGSKENATRLMQGANIPIIDNANSASADMFSFIVQNAYQGDKANEEMQKKRAEMLSKTLGIATDIPALAVGGPWTAFAIGAAKKQILNKIAEGPAADSSEVYGKMDAETKTALRQNTMNLLLTNGWLDKSTFDRANDTDHDGKPDGKTYVAPPAGALKTGSNGKPVHPKQFDFSSEAYIDWANTVGLEGPLTDNIVNRYNSSWPNVN